MRRLVPIAAALAGCLDAPPVFERTPEADRVAEAAEAGWVEAELPDPAGCLAYFSIHHVPEDVLMLQCGAGAGQCLVGTAAVLPCGADDRDAIHEAMHLLYACTVFDPDDPNPFGCDFFHTDFYDYCHRMPGVWSDYPVEAPGGPDSAQSRARERYDRGLPTDAGP